MNAGTYSPIFRMAAGQQERMEAIAENLANFSAPGYKRLQASHKLFETAINNAWQQNGMFNRSEAYDPLAVDFSQGATRPTERPLDFALTGQGFFVVSKDGRDYYTRKGDFALSTDGNLVNADGLEVQGVNGPIRIPATVALSELSVDDDGTIRTAGRELGKLRVATFSDQTKLQRAGTTLFAAQAEQTPETPAAGAVKVSNQTLENSNTTVFEEMADMIACMRSYEACQKMIREDDDNTGKAIQQLSQ